MKASTDHHVSGPPPVMIERVTRGGRRLFYRIDVIQQPEKCRACGSGPKSSTDRRPVDPPPVVELRIFEGPRFEEAKDITFTYNANFFLFATLEKARPMAHGRVTGPVVDAPPVLTGMPVSGMAYLDRPIEAGYFLFPDLSVRHEGTYRLSFNLYEETKDDRDKDMEPDEPSSEPQGFFYHRMEIKSADFACFSAKKFPGLGLSTPLSMTMAEQGTRVRIRRDVRMRRRDGKPSSGGGDFSSNSNNNAEDEAARRRRTRTPEPPAREDLRRSLSGTGDAPARNPEPQRRPSAADYRAPPPPNPPPPGFPSAQVPATSHLTFGGAPYGSHSQYQQPTSSSSSSEQVSSVPQSPAYSSHAAQQHYGQAPQPPTPTYPERRLSDHRSSQPNNHPQQSPHQHSYSHRSSPQRERFMPDSRRPSAPSHSHILSARPMTPQSANELRRPSDYNRPIPPPTDVLVADTQATPHLPPIRWPRPNMNLPSPPSEHQEALQPLQPAPLHYESQTHQQQLGGRKRTHDSYEEHSYSYGYSYSHNHSHGYGPTPSARPPAKNRKRPEDVEEKYTVTETMVVDHPEQFFPKPLKYVWTQCRAEPPPRE